MSSICRRRHRSCSLRASTRLPARRFDRAGPPEQVLSAPQRSIALALHEKVYATFCVGIFRVSVLRSIIIPASPGQGRIHPSSSRPSAGDARPARPPSQAEHHGKMCAARTIRGTDYGWLHLGPPADGEPNPAKGYELEARRGLPEGRAASRRPRCVSMSFSSSRGERCAPKLTHADRSSGDKPLARDIPASNVSLRRRGRVLVRACTQELALGLRCLGSSDQSAAQIEVSKTHGFGSAARFRSKPRSSQFASARRRSALG